MNYYLVKCKFGHVGKDKYLPLDIPVCANTPKDACKMVKKLRGIKRNHKDWCLEIPKRIDFQDYIDHKAKIRSDIYFEKKTRSRLYLFKDRLIQEKNYTRIRGYKTNTFKVIKRKDKENIKLKLKKDKINKKEHLEIINDYLHKNIVVTGGTYV